MNERWVRECPPKVMTDEQQQQKIRIRLALGIGVAAVLWYLAAMLIVLR